MTVWEFLARSEWPIIAGIALWLFHRPIAAMVARLHLTKLDAWGLKAEFEKGLDKVDKLIADKEEVRSELKLERQLRTNSAPETRYTDALLPFLFENVSPEAVVLDSWSRFEADMRAMWDALHPRSPEPFAKRPLRIELAANEFGLSDDEIESLMVLRKLRNTIAHSSDRTLSWEDAIRFRESTERLMVKMRATWEKLRKK
jgi:hypothetical protein